VKGFEFISPTIAREAQPGQFVMVWVPGVDEIPMGIASANGDKIEIAVSKVGECTEALHAKPVGDNVGLRGPFGKGFSFDEPASNYCFVVGGYGSVPLRFAAESLVKKGKKIFVLMGAKTSSDLLFKDVFKKLDCDVSVATDDGSEGHNGSCTELLPELIGREKIDCILTCGPELMMRSVFEVVSKHGIPIQASIERHVKCGVSGCGSCDCGGFRICKEGPVFDLYELMRKTEFGRWKRDKTGLRVAIVGSDISSVPSKLSTPTTDPMLQTTACGVNFPNPLMNASGFATSGKFLYRLATLGAGAMVTKSIGLEPKEGYKSPIFFELATGEWVNAVGLANPGIDNYELEIKDARTAQAPLILSVFAYNLEDCKSIAKKAVALMPDMIELNVSCPHTAVSLVESDADVVKEFSKTFSHLAHSKDIPISVKISPNIDCVETSKAIEEGNADAITLINTQRIKPVESTLGINFLGNPTGFGGRSGVPLANVGKKIVYDVAEEVNIPIVAVGGIFSGKDIIDYAKNGASLFQIFTVLVVEGLGAFERIKDETRKILTKEGAKNISEVVGSAHKA
jgi:dihydroorotate dehydrogenase electron transfer subunit